jgi:hypothetical protein
LPDHRLGIAVDDTIHYLNRFLLQDKARPVSGRLIETSREIGPVLVGTTVIVLAGLSTTFLSGLPTGHIVRDHRRALPDRGHDRRSGGQPALVAAFGRRWFEGADGSYARKSDEITA